MGPVIALFAIPLFLVTLLVWRRNLLKFLVKFRQIIFPIFSTDNTFFLLSL